MISVGGARKDRTATDEDAAPRHGRSPGSTTAVVGTVLLLFVAFIAFLIWQNESFGSTDGGHVAIVRNGGPFDNTKIRQVLPASSGRADIGMFSALHDYPTSQRFYTISSSGAKADANESVTVPTADGVNVGIEGSAYFTLNTDFSDGFKVLKDFDNKYGKGRSRTPPCRKRSPMHRPSSRRSAPPRLI